MTSQPPGPPNWGPPFGSEPQQYPQQPTQPYPWTAQQPGQHPVQQYGQQPVWGAPPPPLDPMDKRRRTNKRILIGAGAVFGVLLLIGVLGALAGGGSGGTTTAATASTSTPAVTTEPADDTATADNADDSSDDTSSDDTSTDDGSDTVTDLGGPYKALTSRQWKRIARNPDGHVGERYRIYGVVTQADSATGQDAVRADVDGAWHRPSYGYYDGFNTNAIISGKVGKLVEDDVFRADVVIAGSYSYETTLGGETTVPQVISQKTKIVGQQG